MKKLSGEEREELLVQLLLELVRGDRTEGSLVRTLRKDLTGLNQEGYAALVGISRRTLSEIERDAGNQTLPVMNRVLKPFGLQMGLLPRSPDLRAQFFRRAAQKAGEA